MKIAIVCPYDYFRHGGVQTHIRDTAAQLRHLGHTVYVIAPTSANPDVNEEYLVQFGKRRSVIFNKTQIDVSLAWGAERQRLKNWLKAQEFDVIHFHTIWDPFLPFQILIAAGPAARVATFHDTPPKTIGGFLTKKLFFVLSYILNFYLDAVIAVSSSPRKHLCENKAVPIHIVPPFIDYAPYFSIERQSRADDIYNILFIGRLEPRKGVLILLDAIKSMQNDGLLVSLTIAGDGDLAEAIKLKISGENIQFVALVGAVDETQKKSLISRADIFCAPSLYGESFGIVLVEAMAAGIPVVAAANSGYSEVMKGQRQHCIAGAGDSFSLADKLKNIIKNKDLQAALGQWGKAEVEKYDCAFWVNRLVDIYQGALATRKKPMTGITKK
jgi:phosphatidyl-myo-inositol alpha-mannosyltransferase